MVFVDKLEGLQCLMDEIIMTSKIYGLDINRKINKILAISKKCVVNVKVLIQVQEKEGMKKMEYRGTII